MRVRELRKKRGLSQREMAGLLDPPVTHAAISEWERGKSPLPDDRVEDIARVLEVRPIELMGGSMYVAKTADLVAWRTAVLMADLSLHAQVALMYLPLVADYVDTKMTFTGSISTVASRVRNVTADQLRAVWPEVLRSGFVERHTDAEWVLRLTIPINQ